MIDIYIIYILYIYIYIYIIYIIYIYYIYIYIYIYIVRRIDFEILIVERFILQQNASLRVLF